MYIQVTIYTRTLYGREHRRKPRYLSPFPSLNMHRRKRRWDERCESKKRNVGFMSLKTIIA